jgi:histone deacetylase complex subunit SAP18
LIVPLLFSRYFEKGFNRNEMGLESKIVEDVQRENEFVVDREKTCPLLLRVFVSTSGHHNSRAEYSRGTPSNELQIYTWQDATLKELTKLITEVYPNTKTKGTQFEFAVVWPNPRTPGFNMKEIGSTTIGTKGPDDNSTLQSKKFVIGDYLDVSVSMARGAGHSASSRGGDSRGAPRDVRGSERDRGHRSSYRDHR